MLLAANAGNSTVKVTRVASDGSIGTVERLPASEALESASLDRALMRFGLALGDPGGVQRVALVTVVPAVAEAFAALAAARRVPLFVATAAAIPIPVRVAAPDSVGADRLLNAFASARVHGAPAVVVDFGTATTVTAVAADGGFLGGAIAPGLVLGLEALANGTAALPFVEPAWPERAAGRDTVEAIRSGAVIGHLGAVRELVTRTAAELSAEALARRPLVVLAGGLATAPWWSDLGADVVDADLTLRGLALLAAEQPVAASSAGTMPG